MPDEKLIEKKKGLVSNYKLVRSLNRLSIKNILLNHNTPFARSF